MNAELQHITTYEHHVHRDKFNTNNKTNHCHLDAKKRLLTKFNIFSYQKHTHTLKRRKLQHYKRHLFKQTNKQKSTSRYIILSGRNLKSLHLIGKRQNPIFTTAIHHCTRQIGQEKEKKYKLERESKMIPLYIWRCI